MKLRISFVVMAVCCSLIGTCSKNEVKKEKPQVFVSIAPQHYFVEKIAGNLVDISVLIQPGANHHTYEPKSSQMGQLANSHIWFTIGLEFENAWVPRIQQNARNLKVVPTDTGIKKIMMTDIFTPEPDKSGSLHETHSHCEHGHEAVHEKHGGHNHEGFDPHIWLSPELVKMQASIIKLNLQILDSSNAATYEKNYQIFIDEIGTLQEKIKESLINCQPRTPFMVFHPSWGYFAHEFNLVQIAIEIEGKEPSPRELAAIISYAKEKKIRTIFTQPNYSPQTAQQVALEIGGHTAVADPLSGNWFENLVNVAKMIGTCDK
jgi:zinc transport system substrate-binding protein